MGKKSVEGDYASSGVNYEAMDPFKRQALAMAKLTAHNINRPVMLPPLKVLEGSYGESAFLTDIGPFILAQVIEGLGTKNIVAEKMRELTGESYYANVAQCGLAMIVNDLLTTGALPVSVLMYLAAGHSDWFKDEENVRELIEGWAQACDESGVVWGGGETPTLRDIIRPGTIDLAGCANGVIYPKTRWVDAVDICEGDAIVIVRSSGVHANGITKIRDVAEALPKGYLTEIEGGIYFGEAVLSPTTIYRKLLEAIFERGIKISYIVNVTGHGWRKFMRPVQPWVYVFDSVPEPHPEFRVIQKVTKMTDEQIYGDYNMGAGFAFYVSSGDAERLVDVANMAHYDAMIAGYIEKPKKKKGKRVVIRPLGIEYGADSLQVR